MFLVLVLLVQGFEKSIFDGVVNLICGSCGAVDERVGNSMSCSPGILLFDLCRGLGRGAGSSLPLPKHIFS
jgi:hypothetical protein